MSSERIRQPGVLGWVLIAICFLAGFISGVPEAHSSATDASSYPGCALFFVPVAFALGFFLPPLLIRETESRATYPFWLFSGLAPLVFLASAFASSALWGSPDWGSLVNTACPLGISLGLGFRESPLESDRNLF